MPIEYVQHSAATATTGAEIAVELLDVGTGTDVQVQIVKFGYGTIGNYNEVATGQGLPVATGAIYSVQPVATSTSPVSVGTWTATGIVRIDTHGTATLPVSLAVLPTTATLPVTVATGPTLHVEQSSTATSPVNVTTWSATAMITVLPATTSTSPVSLTTLPSTATLPVTVATNVVFAVQQSSTATSPVNVTTWSATAMVSVLPATTSTSPVSVGTWTATGIVRIDTHSTATLPVSLASLPTTATLPVVMANTATIQGNVGGRWAHDATSSGNPVYMGGIAETTVPAGVADGDVVQFMADVHGRQVIMPFSPRSNIVQYYISASATADVTLATGASTAGRFRDLVGLVVFNAATTLANISIESSSTATSLYLSVAGDGGGISLQPSVPWLQAVAATNWVIGLASAVVGKVHFSAQFHETT